MSSPGDQAGLWTRRRFLSVSLTAAAALRLDRVASALDRSAPLPVCRLTPEQEVGPFYVADEAIRSDITEGKPGLPLALNIRLIDARTCRPLPNAAVDIWHCDAMGIYSGFTKASTGPGGPPPGSDRRPGPPGAPPKDGTFPSMNRPTDGSTFLRGIQLTGPDGGVEFRTVFPGFYPGRTNHVHFKVRLDGRAGKSYESGHTSHIGQTFFPEKRTARLMTEQPYSKHAIRRTTQTEDQVFSDQQGELSLATVKSEAGSGWRAELTAAVDPSAVPAAARRKDESDDPR